MRSQTKWIVLLTFVLGLASCGSEVVPARKPHPPTPPDQVQIFQKPPQKYERIGVIALPVESTKHWEQTSDATRGFERLKAQAAGLGANGVLLIDDVDTNYIQVGALYKGKTFLVPMRENPPTAVAQAIYVLKE